MTATSTLTPVRVVGGSGGGAAAVDSVDGRTGVVTLGDRYVDVGGDTMTGDLRAPRVGIGTVPTQPLDIARSDTHAPATDRLGIKVIQNSTYTTAETGAASHYSIFVDHAKAGPGAATSSNFVGAFLRCTVAAGNANSLVSLTTQVRNTGAGALTDARHIYVNGIGNSGGGTIALSLGIDVGNQGAAGITNSYGIRVLGQTGSTDSYGVAVGTAGTATLWVGWDTNSSSPAGGIAFGSSRDTVLYRTSPGNLNTDGNFGAKRLILSQTSASTTLVSAPGVADFRNTNATDGNFTEMAWSNATGTAGGAFLSVKNLSHASGYGEFYFLTRSPAGAFTRLRIPNTGGLEVYGDAGAVVASIGNTGKFALNYGAANVIIGVAADPGTGAQNTAIGHSAMKAATTGFGNTIVGQNSSPDLTTGTNNVVIGLDGGAGLTTGSTNVLIGPSTAVNVGGVNGCVAIGSGAQATSNNIAIGPGVTALHNGAVGLGGSTNANNDFCLGTATHNVRVPGTLAAGAGAAGSGVLRLPNNQIVRARNGANTADVDLLKLSTADVVLVGGAGNTGMVLGAGGVPVEIPFVLHIGTNFATTGSIGLPNGSGGAINFRTADNTTNLTGMYLSATNGLVLAGPGQAVQLNGNAHGFFGTTPVAKPTVPAAATDATTTQTLANSLRTALLALGLAA